MTTGDAPEPAGDLPRLGRPANGALKPAGVTSLAQVVAHGRSELLAIHGIGPKAMRLLEGALREHGLMLSD